MSKRKRQDSDSDVWQRTTKRRTTICLEDLPDELLFNILIHVVLRNRAPLVCRKWHQMMGQSFARQLCFERWGRELCASYYEKSDNGEAKKILLQEYFIPLVNEENVDWKRYYRIRSVYERLLRHYAANETERAINIRRVREALNPNYAPTSPVSCPAFVNYDIGVTSEDLNVEVILRGIKNDYIASYEEANYLTQLYCEIGKLDLEQGGRRLDPSFFDVRTWKYAYQLQDRAQNYEHCLSMLKIYYIAEAKNMLQVQTILIQNIIECFCSSLFELDRFYEILTEIFKLPYLRRYPEESRIKDALKLELNMLSIHSNYFRCLLLRVAERIFKKGNKKTKLQVVSLFAGLDQKMEEKLLHLILDHISQNNMDELSFFLPWLLRFGDVTSGTTPDLATNSNDLSSALVSCDLAYSAIVRVVLKPGLKFSAHLMMYLIGHLTLRRAQSMFTTSQLNSLLIFPSDFNVTKAFLPDTFYENLPLFGKRLEPYLVKLRSYLLFESDVKRAKHYLQRTLLKAYPDEAAKAVTEMIKTKQKICSKLFSEASELLESCLGDQFDCCKNEFVDMALSCFPETGSLRLILNDRKGTNITIDQLPAGDFDATFLSRLTRLVIIARKYQLDQNRQYRILYLALIHLKAKPDSVTLWDLIQQMPVLDQVTEEALPYYIAILTLAPITIPIHKTNSCVIKLITTYPWLALNLVADPLRSRLSITLSAIIVCYYGLDMFLQTFFQPQTATLQIQAMLKVATEYLISSPIEDEFYNIVRLLVILIATSYVDSRIEKFTCHEHDWDLVLDALNHPTVQDLIGTQYLMLTKQDLDDLIPQYFK